MQISTGQDGIQRLLAAEQEAQKIVTAARKGRPALICSQMPYEFLASQGLQPQHLRMIILVNTSRFLMW